MCTCIHMCVNVGVYVYACVCTWMWRLIVYEWSPRIQGISIPLEEYLVVKVEWQTAKNLRGN